MTKAKNDIELAGSQLLYVKPEALHSVAHSRLRFQRQESPAVEAETLHLVPLLIGEFPQAMRHYPIIFAGPERTPLAVMGLRAGENLFMKDGKFEDGMYVPAYLRRYPFTLADAGGDQFVVCIDRAAPGFVEGEEGEALFDAGEPTPFTRNAIAFLDEFESERRRTQMFIDLAEVSDLFEVKNTVIPGDSPEHLADYFGISEEKLNSLPDDKLAELVKRGAVTVIDMHLASLRRWDELIERRAARDAAAAEPEAIAA
ncbi:SapC family protein [Sphingomonas sp. CJ20]